MKDKRRRKKLSKAKLIRNIIILIVVLAGLAGGVMILRKKVSSKFASKDESDISSASVEAGSISTTVYGSGQLADDDVEEIEIPSSIEIEEMRASVGDAVEEGDVLATVSTQSVITAMSEVQSEINDLDDELEDAEDDEISSSVKASVSGRVKKIYVESGDIVTSVMYDNNALMIISADGYMAVDIESGSLKEGESVKVKNSDETEYSGTVKYVSGDKATVLFSDNGPEADDTVQVTDEEGNVLGSGSCYVNSPISVVGYGGTVNNVSVSENSYVYSGSTLLTLTDTEYTINFETLLKERSKLEKELAELLEIYKKGAVCASVSGSIKAVPDEDEEINAFTISPDKTMTVSVSVDETDILALEVGQEATLTISSIGDEEYTGTVTAINKTGTGSDGVTSYTADIQIEKQAGMLEGMTAEAGIKIQSVDNTLMVASDAVNITSSSAYVYTTYDEETDELGGMKEVTVGISNSSKTEIVSGLTEGETVYYKEKADNRRGFGGDFGGFGGGGFGGSGGGPDFGGSGGGPSFGGGDFTPPSGGGGMSNMPGGN
jgi:multidrug efflux pump subunit AcrA (membrane-fusion protein)